MVRCLKSAVEPISGEAVPGVLGVLGLDGADISVMGASLCSTGYEIL